MDSFKGSIMEKLFQVLRSRADFFPHQTALMTDAGDHQDIISNQQLWQKIASVTAVFTQEKVQCVGLYMDNCSEWVICDLAAASLGITLVPIPLSFTPAQVGHLAKSAQLDAIITKQASTLALNRVLKLPCVTVLNFFKICRKIYNKHGSKR
jgi:long-chain acyl-CoA synthetase